jgi:peroxiredoxin
MNKPNRDKRPPRPVQAPKRRDEPKRPRWKAAAIAAAVVALLGASFVVPGFFDDDAAVAPMAAHGEEPAPGVGMSRGAGPEIGSVVDFDERDVVTGEPISSQTLAGRKTLLFFSEGVMCQACFVQIRDIEQVGDALKENGIDLVSITPDPPGILKQAIDQYGISTPMIADDDRDMSEAFNTLGQGMHPDTPGHAFVLLDETGKVLWQRDYWLEPYRTMYVEPRQLLAEIPQA